MLSNIKVLMYHRIANDPHHSMHHWTCVPADEFRTHLQVLDRLGFTTITFDDYRLGLHNEVELPRKPIIITIDDGYLDTYETAIPIMQGYGMKGVVFVLGSQRVKTNRWDESLGVTQSPLMQAEHIFKAHEAGFEIGSHSLSHPDLASLNEHQAWVEIAQSKMALEVLLEAPVQTFAYPYGSVTPSLRQMVIDAGYSHGCGVYSGPPSMGTDPFDIRRIPVPAGISTVGFATRMLTPYEQYQWLRWKAATRFHRHRSKLKGTREPVRISRERRVTMTERER